MIISGNGHSWNAQSADQNACNVAFKFTQGDQIDMCYDRKSQKLKFYKDKNTFFAMKNIKEPTGDEFYVPCVNMNSQNESVEIVRPN